jgi:adenylosuccinate lyase
MNTSSLQNISPVDGRYVRQTEDLKKYFSESAFFAYRTKVEIEYFIYLFNVPELKKYAKSKFNPEEVRRIYLDFNEADAGRIREIEKTTNHDVKALEYFLRDKWEENGWGELKEWIHFGLTSQDVNNVALPLMLKDSVNEVLLPEINKILQKIKEQATEWKDIPMLAHTHGQPASPTGLGKEWMVFHERLEKQLALHKQIPYAAKFGGATGNLNAHYAAFPQVNWMSVADAFISSLGLERSRFTTQIEHYDMLAARLDAWKRISVILLDFCRDVWLYISMEYFKQKIKPGEVGSSAMPHKVNPIDFENAEGNLGIAIALFEHLSSKLPVSRLQRDLTDSTVLRNLGVPFAHLLVAFKSIQKGLDKLLVNREKIQTDLENNWAVVAEAVQTILRREQYPDPYNILKNLTRTGEKITAESLHAFIDELNVSEEVKKELKNITPMNYTGNALLF